MYISIRENTSIITHIYKRYILMNTFKNAYSQAFLTA